MKRLLALTALSLFALSGCTSADPGTASTPDTSPEVSESAEPSNRPTCMAFARFTFQLGDYLETKDKWDEARGIVDEFALESIGDVSERLAAMVDEWPEAVSLVVYRETDDVNRLINDVGRACNSEGATAGEKEITFATFHK